MKPKNGFVLGKFMPPHNGHVYMCEFAKNYCEKLTILVCSQPDEPIPGNLRFRWMREMFPDCNVRWHHETVQQEPHGEDDFEFWATWKRIVMTHDGVPYPYTPDVVFASEDYGHRLAAEVNARFVPVDISRTARAISGTEIRANPIKHWEHIPNVVRPFFVKRVVLFGPESTGKSTLAGSLGTYYNTIVAPEYGRTYTETFGPEVTAEDLRRIVSGHLAGVSAAKRQANRILIEDTDPVMTAVWSNMLLGSREAYLDEFCDYPNLYILTKPDLPWVDDGTRYFSDETERWRFFNICEQELIKRKVPYVTVSEPNRMTTAIRAIDAILI